jgi:hypothetical protein
MDPRRNNASHAPSPAPAVVGGSNGNGFLNTVLVVLLILTSLMVLAFLGNRLLASRGAAGAVKSKQYQALFLTNGQVYFGHLKSVDNSYVKMNDIYYLQVQQQVQPSANTNNNQQPQVSLAKLGSELHGPEDVMYVSRDQVLFWENLKEDGKVAQAIKDYQGSGKK